MPALVLDAGALIAADRGDREIHAKLRVARNSGFELRSNGAVIAEVWRDERGRRARLARLLQAVDIVAVDDALGRRAGALLGNAGTDDPVDATVAAIATAGDHILTSDPGDIGTLLAGTRHPIRIVPC